MTALLVVLASAGVTAGGDLCVLDAGAAPEQPDLAELYAETGAAEERAGDERSALEAYREALRLAPSQPTAAEGHARLCRRREAVQHAGAAASAMLAEGRPEAALALLSEVDAPEPLHALLRGMAHHALGQDERASRWLLAAQEAPELAPTAAIYLGLIEARRGRARTAVRWFEEAGRSPELAGVSRRLSRAAAREGRLNVVARAGVELDSNPALRPDGTAGLTPTGDVVLGAAGTLEAKPLGESGPHARVRGSLRGLRALSDFDTRSLGGDLGYRLVRSPLDLGVEAGFDYLELGGRGYVRAVRAGLGAQWSSGSVLASVQYGASREEYLAAWARGYSGTRHHTALEVGSVGEDARLAGGYRVTFAGASDPALGYVDQGPLLRGELRLGRRLLLFGLGTVAWRRYARLDPLLGALRQDVYLELSSGVELDLHDAWTVSIGGAGRWARSNIERLQHVQLRGGVALLFRAAVL